MPIDWRSKVEGLFAKANANGTTPEEAQSLQEKAMYLMNKFGIEDAELRLKNGKIEKPISETFFIGSPYSVRKADLLAVVATFLGAQAVARPGKTISKMFIVGFRDDIERIKVLYHSLLAQMHIDMFSLEIPKHENSRAYRNAFIVGFIGTIHQRMDAIQNRIKAEPGTDIVLFDRKDKIDAAVNEMFEIAGKKEQSISISSSAGLNAGVNAGQRADIGQSRLSG